MAAPEGNMTTIPVSATQAVLMGWNEAEGEFRPVVVDASGRLETTATIASEETAATATLANVSGSATSGTLLASNTARKKAIIVNDSSAILYVMYGAGTASATAFTVRLDPGATLIEDKWAYKVS